MSNPFEADGAPETIAVGATTSTPRKFTENPDCVRIVNLGTAFIWFKFGDSAVTVSTTTGQAIGPGVHEVQRVPVRGPAFVAIIAAGATGDVQFTPGSGL